MYDVLKVPVDSFGGRCASGVDMITTPGDVFDLADHLGPNDPFGITIDEYRTINTMFVKGHRYPDHPDESDVPLLLCGHRIVILPDDWT